jgi:hypothetical protein
MCTTRTYLSLAIALMAVAFLAGCQSDDLKSCKSDKALLDQRIKEYKQLVEMKDKIFADNAETIKNMGVKFTEMSSKIAILEKENEDLRKQLSITPESSQRLIRGAEEIRKFQLQAAARLKEQQPTDANKPK